MSAYVVQRAPVWRRMSDGRVELLDPRTGAWHRFTPATGDLLDAVARGEPYDALAKRLEGAEVERRARQFVLHLSRMGYVEVPLRAPKAFGGRYEVERELGRGGMGVAYLCRDVSTGARVVVKTAWDHLAPLDIADAATRREADVLARLDHPAIVRRVDAFEEDGVLRLVRSLAMGADLQGHEGAPMGSAAEAVDVVRQVLHILDHVHARGFLLGDVRASNFLRADDGRVTLIDVGLARPHEGDVAGDLHALGALYVFLRTGRALRAPSDLASLAEDEARLVRALLAGDASPLR